MKLLLLDTSKYDDPLSETWHAAPRYTASYLRKRGIDTAVRFVPVLCECFKLDGCAPTALYFELSDDTVSPSLHFLTAWRQSMPYTRFFIGGALAGRLAEELLCRFAEIDGIIIGECDATLADAMFHLQSDRPISSIPGLCIREAMFQPRPPMKNLDDLGMMVRDGFDTLYQRLPPEERVTYLLAGRGCYAACNFCSVPDFIDQSSTDQRWRGRSVELVVDEMETFVRDYDVHRFLFQDHNFFGPGRSGQIRARAFATEILQRRLQVEYFITCRINDIDGETLHLMKVSGLRRLGIGIESLNQRSLSLFNKGYQADAIYPALQVVNDVGLTCEVNLIFFEPLMTLADVKRNLDFIEYLARHERHVYSDSFPFKTLFVAPWSRIAVTLLKQGALEADGVTCRFHDQRVAALAGFADQLSSSMPRLFKRRLFVGSPQRVHAAETAIGALHDITFLTTRLRDWLGLTVVPQYMRAAISLVENNPNNFTDGLARLKKTFEEKMAVLHRLGIRLNDIIVQGHDNTSRESQHE